MTLELVSYKFATRMNQLTKEEIKLWSLFLRHEGNESLLKDHGNFFNNSFYYEEANEEIRIVVWRLNDLTIIDMNAWPGDNEHGGIFLNGKMIYNNGDSDLSIVGDHDMLDVELFTNLRNYITSYDEEMDEGERWKGADFYGRREEMEVQRKIFNEARKDSEIRDEWDMKEHLEKFSLISSESLPELPEKYLARWKIYTNDPPESSTSGRKIKEDKPFLVIRIKYKNLSILIIKKNYGGALYTANRRIFNLNHNSVENLPGKYRHYDDIRDYIQKFIYINKLFPEGF